MDLELLAIQMTTNLSVLVNLDILEIQREDASLNVNQLLVALKILNVVQALFVNHQNALRVAELIISVLPNQHV